MRAASQKRFVREHDPFAYSEAGNQLAMADIEGRRRPEDPHDHCPDLWDKEPWSDDPPALQAYQKRQSERRHKRERR